MKKYRFTFGPWNISTGADPFGPPVRREVEFAQKIREYKKLGFDGVQFHDDDVVPADLDPQATMKGALQVKKMLEGEGLFCEFIAPRLWEHPNTIDGGYTANSAADRRYAIDRSKRAVDIANALGCRDLLATENGCVAGASSLAAQPEIWPLCVGPGRLSGPDSGRVCGLVAGACVGASSGGVSALGAWIVPAGGPPSGRRRDYFLPSKNSMM